MKTNLKTYQFGRVSITMFPKVRKPSKNEVINLLRLQVESRDLLIAKYQAKIKELSKSAFTGLWTEKMTNDYEEYCKAQSTGKYYPDPRD